MCEPISIALAGMSLGMDVAGSVAQNAAAGRTRTATDRAARAADRDTIAGLTARKREEDAAAALQLAQAGNISLVEQGEAQAYAADANVQGNSVDAVSNTLAARLGLEKAIIGKNLASTTDQLRREAIASGTTRQDRVNAAPQPQGFGTMALGILSTGVGIASSLYAGRKKAP